MKVTLMLEGSPAVLAAILANLPAGATTVSNLTTTTGDDEEGDDNAPLNTAAPAVDSTGLPWDERIHSGNKGTTDAGAWKKRKGGPKGEALAAIEVELRQRQASAVAAAPMPAPIPVAAPMPLPVAAPAPVPVPTPLPVAAPTPLPVPVAAPVAAPIPMPASPEPAPVPVAAPVEQPAAAAPAVDPATVTDFAAFMTHITPKMSQQGADGLPVINMDYLATVAARIGTAYGITFNAITDLSTQPQYIPYAIQLLQADGRW